MKNQFAVNIRYILIVFVVAIFAQINVATTLATGEACDRYVSEADSEICHDLTERFCDLGCDVNPNEQECRNINRKWRKLKRRNPELGDVECPCVDVSVEIVTDTFGGETTWELRDSDGVVDSGGPLASNATITVFEDCVNPDCYELTVFDSFGDGILAPGGFSLTVDGVSVSDAGGAFTESIISNDGFGECLP